MHLNKLTKTLFSYYTDFTELMNLPEPNFLVIGGMRCATGWIRQCLREHPEIYMPQRETHYFDKYYENGKEWWLNFFSNWKDEKIVGEKTATYMCSDNAPKQIAEYNKNMKLICCIRDPIERMYSHYMMNYSKNRGYKDTSFENLATPESEYFKRSLYYTQISKYLEFFPLGNILILIYEDKDKQPSRFISDIYRFLDVESDYRPPSLDIQIKQGALEYSNTTRNYISEVFLHPRSPRFIKTIYSKLRPKKQETRINETIYQNLGPILTDEIQGIEEILNRELTCWKTRDYVDI